MQGASSKPNTTAPEPAVGLRETRRDLTSFVREAHRFFQRHLVPASLAGLPRPRVIHQEA
jgi:hypothetical protein